MTKTKAIRWGAVLGVFCAAGLACQSQSEPSGAQTEKAQQRASLEPSGPGSGRGGGTGGGDRRGTPAEQSRLTTFKPLSAGTLGPDKIPGYRHTLAASKFFLGAKNAAPAVFNNGGVYTRYTGTDGAFIEWSNGYSAGLLNAKSPLRHAAPYSNEPNAHTALVLSYFKERGIPQDQLGAPTFTTEMRSLRHTSDPGTEIERRQVGYTTVLHRKVSGFDVPESHAWARFSKDGDVLAEQVWWPELPRSVLVEAQAFRAYLENPTALFTFRNKLPPGVAGKSGTVVIHHSVAVGEFWRARATYDVADAHAMRSYDLQGAEQQMASWNPPPSKAK